MKARKVDRPPRRLPIPRIRRPRLASGTALGVVIFLLLFFLTSLPARLCFVLSWDVGVLTATLLLIQIRSVSPAVMKQIAAQQDSGKWMVLFLTLIAASASLIAIAAEVPPIAATIGLEKILRIGLIASTIVLSWAFIHTIFALHYAHDYYSRPKSDKHKDLQFPGEDAPNYMDFVYFSFTIGMTFQVSDVQITDRAFRGLALMHGIISFFYSTVIVALTINLFAGLI